LQPAYIPALGIGAWWTVFVLTLHTAWSISTSIALVEATTPERAETPWLGNIGLGVTALLFALGVAITTMGQLRQDPFAATRGQLLSSGVICLVLAIAAFLLPRRTAARETGAGPNPWAVGALGLLAGGAVLLVPQGWNWWAAAAILAIDLAVFFAVWSWAQRDGWKMFHKLALASGAALAYGIHAFVEKPVIPGGILAIRIGNAIFFAGAVALIVFAVRRTRAWIQEAGRTVPETAA
jgi:cytochrome bd-type quinol oxidase subunit 2